MKKISLGATDRLCPQALYLYGTYKEDGTPNFGLFAWFSYCFDGAIGVMASIDGEKLTKDRIRANRMFSANLVTEPLLPLADYLGHTAGYAPGKMDIPIAVEPGKALDVPILSDSPWSFELAVTRIIPVGESEVYLCAIRNVLAAEIYADPSASPEDIMRATAPVVTAGGGRYFALSPAPIGAWGDWKGLRGG